MVQVNVENGTVSASLAAGESIDVPSGETWKVTISCRASSAGTDYNYNTSTDNDSTHVQIDGNNVAGTSATAVSDPSSHGTSTSSVPFDAVLTGGQTVTASGGPIYISGFIVN